LKRGVVLPNFCRIGWQTVNLRNKTAHRPYFQLLDSFGRMCGVDPQKTGGGATPLGELCPMEEFNFSKAAIRFSSALTKDHVFTGVKSLVHQLGEVISQQRQVSLEFSFGKFVVRERDVRLAFAPQFYVANGFEVPEEGGGPEERTAATFGGAPSRETALGLRLDGRAGTRQSSGSLTPRKLAALNDDYDSGCGPDMFFLTGADGGGGDALGPGSGSSCSAPRRAHASNGRPPRGPPKAQPGAGDNALHRQITELEVRASEAMREKAQMDGFLERCISEDAKVRAAKEAEAKGMAQALQKQMEEKQRRRQNGESANTGEPGALVFCAAPENVSRTKESRHRPAAIRARSQGAQASMQRPASGVSSATGAGNNLREALDEQVQAKRAMSEQRKQFERQVEKATMQDQERNNQAQLDHDMAMKKRERELLSQAWDEEKKIKGIKKAIDAIERGKRVPGEKPAKSSVSDCGRGILPGEEQQGPWDVTPRQPLSARGSSLNAAASLALTPRQVAVR